MTEIISPTLLKEKTQRFVREFGLLRNQTPCGMPISVSSAHLLMYLDNRTTDRECTQQELQQTLRLDKSNIARICSALEKDGLIKQCPSPKDRRARIVTLAPKGERLGQSLVEASERRFTEILRCIPNEARKQVLTGLDILSDAIVRANYGKAEL